MQGHHGVVPGLRRGLAEVLAEAALGHGEVGEGHGQGHLLLLAGLVLVADGPTDPIVVQVGVALDGAAFLKGGAGVRVEAEQGIGPGLHRQAALVFGVVVGDAMLRLADGVNVEQGRAAAVEAVDVALQQVAQVGDAALENEAGAVGHADEAHLLADLGLALPGLAVGRHVRHLADEAGGAGLAAGVGIDLGIQDQDLDRHAGHQRPGQVLEADVVHGPVTAHADHRRAEAPLLLAEVLPVEEGEEGLVLGGLVALVQLDPGLAYRLEALGHLAHVALEDAHGHRGGVLEQVTGPGEGVGVVGEGRAPHRGAAGGVDDAHGGAGLGVGVAGLEVAQRAEEAGDPAEPLGIDGVDLAPLVQFAGQLAQGQVSILVSVEYLGDGRGIAEVHSRRQLEAHVGLQAVDEVVQFRQVLLDPALHQGGDGAGEEVDDGLLAAAHAGAVAGDHGLVVGLVEEQGLQGADLLVEVGDADEVRVGGRQVEPEGPLGAHVGDGLVGLGLGHQGAVLTDLDALHAALAGVGVDGDAEEAAAALFLLLAVGPVGLGDGQLEAGQGLQEQAHLLFQGRLLVAL